MNKLKRFLFCKHEFILIYTINKSDEGIFMCEKCGKIIKTTI